MSNAAINTMFINAKTSKIRVTLQNNKLRIKCRKISWEYEIIFIKIYDQLVIIFKNVEMQVHPKKYSTNNTNSHLANN